MRKHWVLGVLGLLLIQILAVIVPASAASTKNGLSTETKQERDARMKWWREARFGMFIHWGVYSVPAGTYKGKRIPGIGEWIMYKAKIPVAEYRQFAAQFNPIKYDPDAWVRMAKDAGVKYIVITSKHHDGFALFDSKVTDWDVVDATPYGKDLLRPLEQACKKYGMRLGFYYSQAQDWNHRGGAKARMPDGSGWDDAQKGSFDNYLDKIAYPQVKEILTGYDIDILWWDTPHLMTKERAEKLLPLLKIRPNIITNNRLGGGYKGDFGTPEQHVPDTGLPGDWETCMTMNHTWGYKSYDNDWKSTETLLHTLVDIASKGGNFLLNVGPTSEGLIPQPSVDRLRAMGKWLSVNGESIYGTKASPYTAPSWGRFTRKPGKLYAHVFKWPQNGTIKIADNDLVPTQTYMLADSSKKPIETKKTQDGVIVQLPATQPDSIDSVVVIEHK